jgi:hypothetical protein
MLKTVLDMALANPVLKFAVACALCAGTTHAQAIGDLVSSDASVSGSVVLAAGHTRVMNGTSIGSKNAAASLRLARGGELRICPHTNVSLTAGKSGRDLGIGVGVGAIEIHYVLASSADTVLTPDFRILMPGPGIFHFAIAADVRGNTCVRSLPGNTASLIVTEMLGDGVHQVHSGDQIVFHNGRVSETDPFVPPDCGCGPLLPPVQRAEVTPVPPPKEVLQPVPAPEPLKSAAVVIPARPVANPETVSPVTKPGPRIGSVPGGDELHVQVDAPFVYRAQDASLPPPPMIATVSLSALPDLLIPIEQPVPPPTQSSKSGLDESQETKHRTLIGKLGSFFAGIFKHL